MIRFTPLVHCDGRVNWQPCGALVEAHVRRCGDCQERHGPHAEATGQPGHSPRNDLARIDRLRVEAQAAGNAAEEARVADQAAARTAVEEGKPVPAPKAAKAKDTAESAVRAVQAAEGIAVETQFAYLQALNATATPSSRPWPRRSPRSTRTAVD